LDKTVGRQNSTVIVHGDHGARIFDRKPDSKPLSEFSPSKLNSLYSTLLAVRAPGFAPAVVSAPVPTPDFVWRFARQRFQGPIDTVFSHFVRASSIDSVVADSVRFLKPEEMLWARNW
jgi:hypothetical protein